MGHDATKIQLGTTNSNEKEVTNVASNPATFLAGLVVCLNSSGALSLASADGSTFGVSMGVSQSDIQRTAVCRKGLGVPVLLTSGFTPTIGGQVAISNTTGRAKAYTGSGDRYVNAFYQTGKKTSILEDGTEESTIGCALIDFPGGL